MSEVQIANTLNIRVHKFETRFEQKKDHNGKKVGELVPVDYVTYGPPMLMDRQATEARVDRILRVDKPEGSNNVAANTAWKRAEFIRPLYEAWKRGEKLPETGTPLAALNFLTQEDVRVLKMAGVLTAEDLAGIVDTNLQQIRLPDMRAKRAQAKRFLEAVDTNKSAAKLAAQEETIRELQAQMAELLAAKNKAPEPEPDVPEVDENGDRIPKRRVKDKEAA